MTDIPNRYLSVQTNRNESVIVVGLVGNFANEVYRFRVKVNFGCELYSL